MQLFISPQLSLLSQFFANMAVVWFGAAFIAPVNSVNSLKSFISGALALVLAMWIAREVKNL